VFVKVFLVRHGETDWQQLEAKGVKGGAKDFAPLTTIGRVQMDTIANDYRLQEAEAVLCSTYTRALESAARLSQLVNKPLHVEHDLHEWLPNKDGRELSPEDLSQAMQDFRYYTGFSEFPDRRSVSAKKDLKPLHQRQIPPASQRSWESLDEVRQRVLGVFQRYQHFHNVVAVTHAVVIASLVGVTRPIEHAEIVPIELDFSGPEVLIVVPEQRSQLDFS
jgi:broad specificity phosphatase PhoE